MFKRIQSFTVEFSLGFMYCICLILVSLLFIIKAYIDVALLLAKSIQTIIHKNKIFLGGIK